MKLKQLFIFLLAIKLTLARYAFVPKFYGQDSAVIVDTDKQLPPTPFNTKRYYHRFPVYQIIQPGKPLPRFQNEVSSTTTSTTTKPEADEFPRDLLVIAQKKLGLKSLDEIPSISELGELLGTDTADETISYIRQLTASEQGVALMKAYMEIDDVESDNNTDKDDNDDDKDDEENVDVAAATADLTVVEDNDDVGDDSDDDDNNGELNSEVDSEDSSTSSNANKPKSGFFDRIASYLNIYNLLPQKQTSRMITTTTTPPQVQKSLSQIQPNRQFGQRLNNQKPFMINNPLPYHYPIPLRPVVLTNADTKAVPLPTASTVPPSNNVKPLLNTPKTIFPPHIQQLSKFSNIPPMKLESFLESKPKLAALAKRISNVSFSNGGNDAVNNQLMTAIKKALEQDDDLRRLLSETDTLK